MKRSIFLLFFLIFFSFSLNSQTVDSIKVEQAGDLIKIHYKILNSTDKQTFRVTVTCSLNGGLQSIPKSLSGDFGENVVGGRSDYMVLWDVLKDVDEIKSVEFVVKAELLVDHSLSAKSDSKSLSRVFAFLVAGVPQTKIGAKIGYMGSWGITAMYLFGKQEAASEGIGDSRQSVFAASLALSKRIANTRKFNMHLFTGINVSRLLVEPELMGDQPDFLSNCIGLDLGCIMSTNRLAFSLGFNPVPESWVKDEATYSLRDQNKIFINIGLGYRF